jgi:methylmalonyl-CoA mutase cobalamin-binding domain/chain
LIGTVKGDLHDIGKNIVATMLRGVGFQIEDLGINVPAKNFVQRVQEYQPDVLALSALLTTTMPEMKVVLRALTEAGLRDKVKVIVGGAPLNEKFANDIGADGYAKDAGSAVDVVKSLLRKD